MRLMNFQAPGLNKAIEFSNMVSKSEIGIGISYNFKSRRLLLNEILKTINVSFTLEGLNRMQSTMLCELKDSYVQQSQRYVTSGKDSYYLPEVILEDKDLEEAKKLLDESFGLYNKMSLLKDEYANYKGRKNASHYQFGIPIEDARYILPLASKTNIVVATTGDKFLNILDLIYDEEFGLSVTDEICHDLNNLGISDFFDYGTSLHRKIKSLANMYYSNIFNLIDKNKEDVILYSKFENPDIIVGTGAATSGSVKTPSEIIKSWGENIKDDARNLTKRVMSYGHTSIIEQSRTSFVFEMSLSAYHQFIRHRLPNNFREDLIDITLKFREPYIPQSIKDSVFYQEYMDLINKFYEFRKTLMLRGYNNSVVNLFLLNCDKIRVASSTNARIDCHMLKDRICKTAQTEIREHSEKKYKILKGISDIFYKDALPPCVYGQCKEGKMTCGNQKEMIEKYKE